LKKLFEDAGRKEELLLKGEDDLWLKSGFRP
jgi:hypothetical protein